MKMMWCWRCKMEMPMLDEKQFKIISELYHQAFSATKGFRVEHQLPIENCSTDDRFRPVRETYEKMTGMRDCHQNAVVHHRVSIYGEPCKNCEKPLRTPQANFCAACGQTKD